MSDGPRPRTRRRHGCQNREARAGRAAVKTTAAVKMAAARRMPQPRAFPLAAARRERNGEERRDGYTKPERKADGLEMTSRTVHADEGSVGSERAPEGERRRDGGRPPPHPGTVADCSGSRGRSNFRVAAPLDKQRTDSTMNVAQQHRGNADALKTNGRGSLSKRIRVSWARRVCIPCAHFERFGAPPQVTCAPQAESHQSRRRRAALPRDTHPLSFSPPVGRDRHRPPPLRPDCPVREPRRRRAPHSVVDDNPAVHEDARSPAEPNTPRCAREQALRDAGAPSPAFPSTRPGGGAHALVGRCGSRAYALAS